MEQLHCISGSSSRFISRLQFANNQLLYLVDEPHVRWGCGIQVRLQSILRSDPFC